MPVVTLNRGEGSSKVRVDAGNPPLMRGYKSVFRDRLISDHQNPLAISIYGSSDFHPRRSCFKSVGILAVADACSASEFGEKPGSGHLPVAHDALRGNLQHFRRLLHAQSREEPELDDSCFAWVDFSQLIQRVVDGYHLPVSRA